MAQGGRTPLAAAPLFDGGFDRRRQLCFNRLEPGERVPLQGPARRVGRREEV